MLRSLIRSMGFALCFFVLSNASSLAQNTTAQVESQLAGRHGRDWVYKKIVGFMGPGEKCEQGEKYRFKADHTLVISRCVDSRMQTETQDWSIESVDALETHIKVGNSSYILRFWDTPKGHFMALRTKAIDKTQETIDKEFQLAEE